MVYGSSWSDAMIENESKRTVPLDSKGRLLDIVYVTFTIILVLLLLVMYQIYDNNRVVVVKEIIPVPGLPRDWAGFTILQLSDLHDKRFGHRQQKLLQVINSLEYDLLALTGDMVSADPQPFYALLEGLERREQVFFARGNHDPRDFNPDTGDRTDFGRALEARGCQLLDTLYPIKRGEHTLWVAGIMPHMILANQGTMKKEKTFAHPVPVRYWYRGEENRQTQTDISAQIRPSDILVGLTHYPLTPGIFQQTFSYQRACYTLILAGHYHGGQFRLPFFGALQIPAPAGPGRILFPAREQVEGLGRLGPYHQYISRGLGASGNPRWLQFRLFNPPEINLLTLEQEAQQEKAHTP